jgi:outer membrane receptor protein involved in Fe transport
MHKNLSFFNSGENRMFRSVSFKALFGALLVFSTAGIAFGQGAGELTGQVTDSTGAVVANVPVTLTNAANGEKRTTVTTPEGIYRFAALPVVGTYIIETAPTGFKTTRIANVVVSVGTVTTRDIQLEIGTTGETVTVEGGTQLVQTEDASISQLVDARVWNSMPLETRSQNEFINLIAGAEPEAFNLTFRGASVNGTRSGTGNYLIEGSDNNEQGQGGVALQGPGGANTTISPDAIQEYRVITHDFPAEYGKAGGFVTDTVLKSGTNHWHGSAFEYNRLQNYTANDWFSTNADIRDHLVRNQFGGSLGGAVVKDKTFFFAAGELHRLRQSSPVTATGVTQQYLNFVNNGGFENFIENDPNGICNNQAWINSINWVQDFGIPQPAAAPCPGAVNLSGSLGPIFQQLRTKQPGAFPVAQATANCANASDPLVGNCFSQSAYAGFFGASILYPVQVYGTVVKPDAISTDQDRFDVKVDHKLSEKDHLTFAYLFDDVQTTDSNGGAASTIGAADVIPGRAQNASINWTRNFSNNILNQARFGYLRRVNNFLSPEAVGVPSIATFIDPIGTSLGASAAIPQFFTENQFQYKDDLSISHGKHNFKMGFEYRRTRNSSKFFNDRYGTVDPWSIEDLVSDLTYTDQLDNHFFGGPAIGSCAFCGASIDAETGSPREGFLPNYQRNYRANEYGAYAQDDWRVSSHLTLNLGLRWEYFGPPHNADPSLDSNFYFGPATTPIATASTNPFFPTNSPYFARVATGSFQTKQPIWNQDKNNFGPRVGFSWDPTGSQKLVVRGGFGIMYDRIYNNIFENIRFNPPFFADVSFGFFGANGVAGGLATPGFYAVPFAANNNGSLAGSGFRASPRHMDQNLVSPYYEQMHFGIQYELAKNLVFETDYVGTLGRKLIGILNDNTFDGRTSGLGSTRPNPTIGSDNFRTNAFGSNYHALQASLRKNYSSGLQLNANYTYSKTLDEISDAFRAKSVAFNACANSDCQNIHLDYGPADFDVRHRAVVSFNYDLPFAKGNRWIGGWQFNGVFSIQSGVPIPIFDLNNDLNADGLVGADRPLYASGFTGKNVTTNRSPALQFLNPSGYTAATCPANVNQGVWCDSPMHRNDVYGPHFVNLDFGLGKSFKITEGSKLTFFANFFDIFNHPNFNTPEGNFSDPLFGKSIATLGDSGGHRVGQLALRFDF